MLLFLLGAICSILVYQKLIKPCKYWKGKGIKCAKSWPLFGIMGKVFFKKQPLVDVGLSLYNSFRDERYVGYMRFTRRFLLIRDIDLIKQITIKDFDHFTDLTSSGRGSDTDRILSKSLVSLGGEKWKDLRATLSPVFSTSNIKTMYPLMEECAEEFAKYFEGEAEFEMREIFSRFASNVIASTAFATKTDCLREPKDKFFTLGRSLSQRGLSRCIKAIVVTLSKKICKFLPNQILPRRATAFFRSAVGDSIQKREKEGLVRPDLIHVLLEARRGNLRDEPTSGGNVEGFAVAEEPEIDPPTKPIELTDDHIVAQAVLFFLAGFDTVATTSSFMAYELALNPVVQKRLQEEIDSVKSKYAGKVPYDALVSMRYLDQVVSETLRLWPTCFETDRLCVKDYLIEAKKPEEKALVVQRGVVASIPIMAIHRDPEYFAEPDRFDPERFTEKNKSKFVPGTYAPFGWGPRNCIGSRFALLEMKTLFCHLLSKFDIVPVKRTEIPIKLSGKSFVLQPTTGFWLGLKPRKESSC